MTDSTPGAHSSSSSSSSLSKLPTLCLTRDIDHILFFDLIDSLQCNSSALSTQRSAPTCGTRPSPWCPRLDDHRQQGYCCAICAVNPRCVNDTPSTVFNRVRDLVMALGNLVAFASNASTHLSLPLIHSLRATRRRSYPPAAIHNSDDAKPLCIHLFLIDNHSSLKPTGINYSPFLSPKPGFTFSSVVILCINPSLIHPSYAVHAQCSIILYHYFDRG